MRRKSSIYCTIAAALLFAFLAAGCKTVKQVETETRALSLDLRSDNPYYNMISGRSGARPVHPGLMPEDLSGPLTLRRSIELALQGHPEIRRWKAKIGEATGRRRELETMGWAELIFDITWAPGWKLGLDDPTASSGDRMAGNTTRFGVALRQPIYFEWQRRRALLNANTENLNSLHNQMEDEVNKVIGEVCKTYLDIMEARLQRKHRSAVYELDRKRVAVVEHLVEKRLLLDSALHSARKFMHAAERDHHAAVQVLKSRERKLKNLLGIDSRIDIKFEPTDFEEIPLIPEEQAYEHMVQSSPRFNAMDHDVRKAYWDKEYMRWEDIDSDIIIRYGYDVEDWSTPIDDFMLVSWTLRYPLMHVKARNARVVQGLKRMEQFAIEREVNQQAALDALEHHYSTILEKSSDISSFQAAVEEAREDLRIAEVFERKGTPDEALKTDPENILLSIISTIKLENSLFDLSSARLDYLRETIDLYATVGRAAELIEYAKLSDIEKQIEAYSRTMFVPDAIGILESKGKTGELFNFCEIEDIATIIVDFTNLEENREKIEAFLKEAHGRSIKVVLKMGGTEWLDAENTDTAKADLEAFFTYNNPPEPEEQPAETAPPETPTEETAEDAPAEGEAETDTETENNNEAEAETPTPVEQPADIVEIEPEWVEPPQKFDGIFLDLTGRNLADWNDGQMWPEERKNRLVEVLEMTDEMRRLEKDEVPVLLLTSAPAAAHNFQLGDGRTLLEKLLSHTDSVSLIIDSDDQSAIVDEARPVLQKTMEKGRIKIAVTTLPKFPEGKSYYHSKSSLFFGELAEIAEKLRPNLNFAGIIIEDYPSLRELLTR